MKQEKKEKEERLRLEEEERKRKEREAKEEALKKIGPFLCPPSPEEQIENPLLKPEAYT